MGDSDSESADGEEKAENENEVEDLEADRTREFGRHTNKKRKLRADEFFERQGQNDYEHIQSFSQLNLSRPLMKAVTALGFTRPTPVQSRCIPPALAGRDIVGSAVTGSGKTAAFLLPTLERLSFQRRRRLATRVLVITPTRELAQQCQAMLVKLGQFTDITSCCIVGGLSLSVQEAELRKSPDVVICTPGRMIDHLRNSPSVHCEDVEILILDEADRLLELGFQDEVHELVSYCPRGRQTLLFSATMTENVEELVKLSMNRPVRSASNPLGDMASRLQQEFIRVRQS